MDIGSNSGAIPVAIGAVLILFGILYDWLASYLHQKGHSEGYTSLLVVGGVLVTILAAGFVIGWPAVIWLLILFACSGTPMVIGDIYRYAKARHEFEQRNGC